MLVEPLSEKHVVELEQACQRALSQWLPNEDTGEPKDIIRALDRVLLFLKQNGDASAQARHVASLAFAFGQQLVRTGAWQWVSVSEDGSVNPSVLDGNGRACLVVDAVTAMVTKTTPLGLAEVFRALIETRGTALPGVVTGLRGVGDAATRFERDVISRLNHARTVLRMWGSPEELEAVAEHFVHVVLSNRTPTWRFEDTHALWLQHGGPFAADADEHAEMRTRLWADAVEQARTQVAHGYLSVWAALQREPEREARSTEWIEALLDAPRLAGTPDRLNAVLFALIGFVATDPQAFVTHLGAERERVGGHSLRPLHVVAPMGPSDAGLQYTRKFTSWEAVSNGIARVLAALPSLR